jgi:hypothetical protein
MQKHCRFRHLRDSLQIRIFIASLSSHQNTIHSYKQKLRDQLSHRTMANLVSIPTELIQELLKPVFDAPSHEDFIYNKGQITFFHDLSWPLFTPEINTRACQLSTMSKRMRAETLNVIRNTKLQIKRDPRF